MAKLRSISTAFWSDPFIEECTPHEKLLFLYLITNEKTNMIGIYEASIKKISFETGISIEIVRKALERFETIGKVKYLNNHVILVNFLKHQNFNFNMKKSAIEAYNELPAFLKMDNLIEIQKDSEGFETLCKAFGTVRKEEYEIEEEVELEDEEEIEVIKAFDFFYESYPLKTGKAKSLIAFKKIKLGARENFFEYLGQYIEYLQVAKWRQASAPVVFINKFLKNGRDEDYLELKRVELEKQNQGSNQNQEPKQGKMAKHLEIMTPVYEEAKQQMRDGTYINPFKIG